jgi:hypothetical protein
MKTGRRSTSKREEDGTEVLSVKSGELSLSRIGMRRNMGSITAGPCSTPNSAEGY